MFIGLSPACVSNVQGGGEAANSNVIGTTVNGDYPADIQAGDVIITALSSLTFVAASIDFVQVTSGVSGGVNYGIYRRVADGSESGSTGCTGDSQSTLVLRNVDVANLIVSVSDSAWDSLAGLTNGSTIVAMGYSDDGSGNFGGATIPSGFTNYEPGTTSIIAVKNESNSGTTFSFTGFSISGTYTMCYSIGIA